MTLEMPNFFTGIVLLLAAMSLACMAEANTFQVCPGCDITKINDAINKSISGDIIEVESGVYYENFDLNKKLTILGINAGDGKPILNGKGKQISILISANGTTVEGLAFRNFSDAGIRITSNDNIIKDNDIIDNNNGIVLIQSTNNSLLNNSISNNKKIGIILSMSENNSIINNLVNNNTFGLSLISSNYNSIFRNVIANNRLNGINILNSNSNILESNVAENNMQIGLNLEKSLNNTLRQNKMQFNRYNFGADGKNDIDVSNLVDGKPIYYMIGAQNVKIDLLYNAGTIYCIDCSNVMIKDQLLTNNTAGIYFYNTTDSRIQNSYLSYNGKGVFLSNSRYNNITLDHTYLNDYPLYIAHSSDNIILINRTNPSTNKYLSYIDLYSNDHNNTLIDISPGPEVQNLFPIMPIRSKPSGAWIYVKGENLSQKTPYDWPIPKEDDYEISLIKVGYHEFSKSISFKPPILQIPSIDETLTPI
jgi:parallel beta-helix repeat protein